MKHISKSCNFIIHSKYISTVIFTTLTCGNFEVDCLTLKERRFYVIFFGSFSTVEYVKRTQSEWFWHFDLLPLLCPFPLPHFPSPSPLPSPPLLSPFPRPLPIPPPVVHIPMPPLALRHCTEAHPYRGLTHTLLAYKPQIISSPFRNVCLYSEKHSVPSLRNSRSVVRAFPLFLLSFTVSWESASCVVIFSCAISLFHRGGRGLVCVCCCWWFWAGSGAGGPYVSFSDACLGYKCCALTHRRQWAVHAHLPDTLGPLLWGQWCGQMWCLTLWCWPCGQMRGPRRMRRCSLEAVVLRAAPPAPALLLAPLGTTVSWRLTRVCALCSFFTVSNLLEGVWRAALLMPWKCLILLGSEFLMLWLSVISRGLGFCVQTSLWWAEGSWEQTSAPTAVSTGPSSRTWGAAWSGWWCWWACLDVSLCEPCWGLVVDFMRDFVEVMCFHKSSRTKQH